VCRSFIDKILKNPEEMQAVRIQRPAVLALLAVPTLLWCAATAAAADVPYTQHEDVVFGESFGMGLVMDIFVPTGEKNGLAIVDVVSGAWSSDRGKIRQHKQAGMYDIFCGRGYTVFAVRPGSISKFSAPEMREHIKKGIRWVKQHSQEYGIDPDRLGMSGASAGGHLASLTTVTSNGDADTKVAATAVFFPPTDFLDYGGISWDARGDGDASRRIRQLAFAGQIDGLSDEEIQQRIIDISPARKVQPGCPPFLIIHGDADPLVPLQQSEVLLKALQDNGCSAELIVKPGGGHPWLTIHEEVKVMADWFDKQLAKK
jgi:acetyl esterase/lipase